MKHNFTLLAKSNVFGLRIRESEKIRISFVTKYVF